MISVGENVGKISTFLAKACWNHPFLCVLLATLTTLAGLASASSLKLEADLSVLLPEHFESVKGLGELEERFGGIGYVVVVAEGAPKEVLIQYAEDVAPKLESLENIRYVDYQRPMDFFESHALYFMELSDLEFVRDRVKARIKWEKKKRNPMYIDFEESEAPSLNFTEIENKYSNSPQGEWLSRQSSQYYLDEEAQMIVLLAKPAARASDLSFAQQLVSEVNQALDELNPQAYHPDLKVALTGRYKKNLEQQARISQDLSLASVLALGLLLLFLLLHLRSFISTGIVIFPLLLGLVWMLGLTGLLFDNLNILTGFLGAILLGLGIDHGIHLMSRYQTERSHLEAEKALIPTFHHTARAVIIAALTTASAFIALAFSEFRAFKEFGIIAAIGLIAVLLAYHTVFPALLSIATQWGWSPPRYAPEKTLWGRLSGLLQRYASPVFWLAAIALAFVVPASSLISFNYDFAALEGGSSPAFVLDKKVNEILGYSQTPVAILTENAKDEADLAAALRARSAAAGSESSVDFVASVNDLIPENQQEKQALLKQIKRQIEKVKDSQLDEDTQEKFANIKKMLVAEPFTRDTLPVELKRQFVDADGEGGFVLVFPGISLADGQLVSAFADEIRGLKLPDGRSISASGEAMILADILTMIGQEAPSILLITLTLIALLTWGLLGSLRAASAVLLPILILPFAILGAMALSGLQLNYMNIIVIPILLGIGVDGTVHLYTRSKEACLNPEEALADTGRAILAALLTTGIGFGALLIAHHPGLNSIGTLSLIGTAANLLLVLAGFSAALHIFAAIKSSDIAVPSQSSIGKLRDRAAQLLATVGWAGHSPVAPGTLGAMVGVPIAWWLHFTSFAVSLAVVATISIVGIVASHQYATKVEPEEDPQRVVIDELAGYLLTTLFVPQSWLWLAAAFVLFRVADIFKPFPINWIEKGVKGGLGIMLDDLLAGLLAGLLLLALQYFT